MISEKFLNECEFSDIRIICLKKHTAKKYKNQYKIQKATNCVIFM